MIAITSSCTQNKIFHTLYSIFEKRWWYNDLKDFTIPKLPYLSNEIGQSSQIVVTASFFTKVRSRTRSRFHRLYPYVFTPQLSSHACMPRNRATLLIVCSKNRSAEVVLVFKALFMTIRAPYSTLLGVHFFTGWVPKVQLQYWLVILILTWIFWWWREKSWLTDRQ